ncbi:Chain length determinant protein [Pseudorhodobacter antarcticus]|uniref:Chain length determinant protein n=1 Tax=Pseudorhodobacter antarcticus TaxID=1077947 RepID=A0A1H8FN35_9RHOB|nr:Wzz/FepE/Etk N-terminal domain-containing protein [Pseudorhodobacter antarcticus]SEN32498.1 Chain length determinant protein [Pseudorhodobacter antarcticus]
MGQIQSIEDLINMLIRRRLLIGAVAVFGMVITVLFVMSKADVFESTALIQVQSPTVSSADGTEAPRESSAQRLQAIQQRLTTRENMLAVIARHDLYAGLPLTDDQKVHLLRISLRFETVASAAAAGFGQAAEVSAILISAQSDTRAKAARVTNDFAQGILDAGAAGQINRAREALDFYREEANSLRAAIDAREAEIAAYQARNVGALPAQRESLRSELTGLETELRSLDQALVAARNERAAIERKATLRATDRRDLDSLSAEIETLGAQSAALEARRAEITSVVTEGQDVDRVLSDYQRGLTQLQTQFEAASRRSAEAETAARLQDRQQGETFSILERGIEADYPISGGRRKLAIVGAFGSLMLGVGLAFLLDQMRPVLRTRSHLERELDLRPIVAIPEMRASGRPLRQWFSKDIHTLSDLARHVPEMRARAAQSIGAGGAPSRVQLIGGGVAVILLVAVAAAMT